MKWILISLLIFIIMLIARALSEQYKDKYDFYLNLKSFLTEFKMNLSFKQNKITDFLEKTNSKKQFQLFIEAYKEYLKQNTLDLSKIKILDDGERNELSEIITSIGRFDSQSEIKQIDTFLSSIGNKLKLALEEKNRISPMILKLSLLFAIGLAIILI